MKFNDFFTVLNSGAGVFTGIVAVSTLFLGSCGNINTVHDPHFDSDGHSMAYKIDCNLDSDSNVIGIKEFTPVLPTKVKFFVEVSGSMNGFFRANRPTDFKADLWHVVSYFANIAPEVTILTNNGNEGASMSQSQFQTKMNTGTFVSAASTKVPVMLQTIMQSINPDADEVAILVSDMKYSPVGAAAPAVLLTQYSTDVATILGKYGKPNSLVCAVSNYLDKQGNVVCDRSPYYYFIIGNGEQVAYMRNAISTLIKNREHFVDNIETGFKFGSVSYSFGVPNKCEQLDDQPTFVAYEEAEPDDTCTIKLKVYLESYRWRMTDPDLFRKCFAAKMLYGSEVKVGKIEIEEKNIIDARLERKATAIVELKVFNMALESDVIEWNINLPDNDITYLNEFFEGAVNENDPSKSFSLVDFIKGMFYGGVVNEKLNPNYILISKNG